MENVELDICSPLYVITGFIMPLTVVLGHIIAFIDRFVNVAKTHTFVEKVLSQKNYRGRKTTFLMSGCVNILIMV